MKKLILPFVLLFILLCGCASDSQDPAENVETAPAGAVEIGNSSYSCITGESERQIASSETGEVNVKAFAHQIYDPNNEYIVTLTTTVTWPTPSGEGTPEMESISGALSDAQIDGLTLSEHLADNIGTVVVYLNRISVCYFQYRISSDGTVELL